MTGILGIGVIQFVYLSCIYPALGAELNLIERIHGQVKASLSSTWRPQGGVYWNASKGVDFDEGTDPNTCNCCAGAHYMPSWWMLDLGKVYPIKKIIYIGRDDGHEPQTTGFSIYKVADGQEKFIHQNIASTGNRFVIDLNPPVALQVLKIKSRAAISVCELKLIENEYCPSGSFGPHCENRCHCSDKQPCNRTTGICQSNGCELGWKGIACNEDMNLIKRIKAEVVASMSTPYSDNSGEWGAERAIDLVEDSRPDICHCCSSTYVHGGGLFWRLDLGNLYPIKSVILIGRSDRSDYQSRFFYMYYRLSPDVTQKRLIWQHSSRQGSVFSKTFQETILMQYLEMVPNQYNTFTICEIKLIEGDCPVGKFNTHCSSTCHCQDKLPCKKDTGDCATSDCDQGWMGRACDTKCQTGLFGKNCTSACHCFNNGSCNHVTGKCPSDVCSPGWQGANCSLGCDAGQFGQNCTNECNCRDEGTCNSIDGRCDSGLCPAGWRDANCYAECWPNTFGLDCSSTCHCANDVACHHINGSCPGNVCASGWQGENCSTAILSAEEQQKITRTRVAVGLGSGLFILVVAATAGVYIFLRRRRRNARQKNAGRDENMVKSNGEGNARHKPKEKKKLFEERKEVVSKLNNSIRGGEAETEDMRYCNLGSEHKIPVCKLWEYLTKAYDDSCKYLYQEFQRLPQGLIHECSEARKPENAKKNRYKEMYAYDHSRVVLRRVDENMSTYINACYVDGFDKPKKFIASQGPTKDMVEDFWQMILQENTSLIIMLTNVIERETRKCIQYWPIQEREELSFGEIKVTTIKISTSPDYVIRQFDVRKADDTSKNITHAHFTAWPDKDVPDASWHLVNFWRKTETLGLNSEGPVVIHCSAGVGRTGTFIALDILHAQAKNKSYLQPFSMVENLRQQRVNMVQTKTQYLFLHEAVAEALYTSPKPIKVNEYSIVYEYLLHVGSPRLKAGLEQQFQLIQEKQEDQPNYEYYNNSSVKDNSGFCKGASSITYASTSRIIHLQNHAMKDAVVLTQLTDASDTERLLELIDERKINTVVSLQDTGQPEKDNIFNSDLKGEAKRRFRIQHQDTKVEQFYKEKLFTVRTFNSLQKNPSEQRVKQFVFRADERSSNDNNSIPLVVKMLNSVQKWQATFDDDQTVLITYRSAPAEAAILCLLLLEFERIRDKDEVNLLATAKHMKQKNPGLMSEYEHYKFCHDAVLEYVRQSDVYMNV